MSNQIRIRRIRVGAAVALMTATAAVIANSPALDASATARTVTITAFDYAFIAPDSIASGLTTIRLVNTGPELHHVQLIRLDEGHTMADLFAALKAGGPPPKWAVDVGGPNSPVPGGESAATLDLAPGRYAIVCFIPSPDGTPHIMKGMARELFVTAARGAGVSQAGAPAPSTTMTLTDYSFAMTKPLVAGTQTVRVKNAASQSHEVFFVKLAPGRTANDVAAWVEKQIGPPPGAPLGGTTGIATGGWNDLTMTFTPGEYAMLCFLPDAKDGKPHVMHGMAMNFTVR